MRKRKILIGCVADDFTGASDAASFLAKGGMRTVLSSGIPEMEDFPDDCDAVVIGLKVRSVHADEAVRTVLSAFRRLEEAGAQKYYYKYCSTFDSTPEGNIGPIVDAAMDYFHSQYALLCPSLPVNGRTVKDGCLFVHGIPLAESTMKDHPLNPMWASDIEELMKPQGAYDCLKLSAEDLKNTGRMENKISLFGNTRSHFYIVPDYETDLHGRQIAEAFKNECFFTGGSGLLEHLAAGVIRPRKDCKGFHGTAGPGIALCGSCSHATAEQIRYYKSIGGTCIAVDPEKLRTGEQSIDAIWHFMEQNKDRDVLVYSVGAEQALSITTARPENAKLLEQTMADLASRALMHGYTRIVGAGGETSGALMLALKQNHFFIGECAAPGVPIMTPTDNPNLRIVLKSGNFGDKDFFAKAFAMTKAPR